MTGPTRQLVAGLAIMALFAVIIWGYAAMLD